MITNSKSLLPQVSVERIRVEFIDNLILPGSRMRVDFTYRGDCGYLVNLPQWSKLRELSWEEKNYELYREASLELADFLRMRFGVRPDALSLATLRASIHAALDAESRAKNG